MQPQKCSYKTLPLLGMILLIAVLATVACSSSSSESTANPPTVVGSGAVLLNGAGATFPYPLYSKWFDEYARITKTKVNYQSIGSGGGIKNITDGTVDFGASDGIMSDAEQSAAENAHGPILHIPMTMGSVAVVVNLPGLAKGQLRLSADVLADIYLKKITRWNDSRITALNPGTSLPNMDIAVVHRSDGSGTTYVFTNYLSKVSQTWATQIGNNKSVDWPGDIGGQGNEGVAGQVRQLPGSIGYVELAYAIQNDMPWVAMKNASGNFVVPSIEATSEAASGVTLPSDMKVMITNSTNPQAYPIAGFTWLLVYANQTDCAKGKAIVNMIDWALHDGQSYSEALHYAPLPQDVVAKAMNLVGSVTCNGQALR